MSYIILPMDGSIVNKDISINNDMHIIVETKDEPIISKITNILKVDEEIVERMVENMNNMKVDFFDHPIFIYNDKNSKNMYTIQTKRYITKFITYIVNLLYFRNEYPKSKIDIGLCVLMKQNYKGNFRPDLRKKNKFLVLVDESDYKRIPLEYESKFNFELEWISNIDGIHFEKMLEIMKDDDNLSRRIRVSSKFFYRAISNDDFSRSEKLIFLHTALECLILKDSNEQNKSFKVRKYISETCNTEINENFDDMFNFIKYMTKSRGKYLHAGEEYKENNSRTIYDIDEGVDKEEDLNVFIIIVSNVILESINIAIDIKKDTKNSKENYEKIYLDMINSKVNAKKH